MNHGVNLVLTNTAANVLRGGNVAPNEGEIGVIMKHLRVFQRSAIVKLVKGNDIVAIGIGDCKGPDEP